MFWGYWGIPQNIMKISLTFYIKAGIKSLQFLRTKHIENSFSNHQHQNIQGNSLILQIKTNTKFIQFFRTNHIDNPPLTPKHKGKPFYFLDEKFIKSFLFLRTKIQKISLLTINPKIYRKFQYKPLTSRHRGNPFIFLEGGGGFSPEGGFYGNVMA